MAEIGMNDLMVAIREMAKDLKEVKADVTELKSDVAELKSDVAELKSDVAKLKVTTKRLELEQSDMREEMNLNFKKLKRKLTILTEEILEARTDITFLEDKVY